MKTFKRYVIDTYKNEDSPEGDFARDLERDKSFPMYVKDGYEIKWYLMYTLTACDEAIDIFESLWYEYKLNKGELK